MINEALLHCPQIGPARLAKLHQLGIRSWQHIQDRQAELPSGIRDPIVEEATRCLSALEADNIDYFIENLATKDRWRILSHYLNHVSFFDIETAGLEFEDPITVIACWHKGELHCFVEHENLDDFLDLLDDVKLLSSFNGSTFDVPRVLDAFHIPRLPCPHLDLRWLCYHQGLRGGLKEISYRININRPEDLKHANGEQAIRLWARWELFQDRQAREDLLRYCASDVLLLVVLADNLTGRNTWSPDELWVKLPGGNLSHSKSVTPQSISTQSIATQSISTPSTFGAGSPSQLRGRRLRAS